MTDACILLVEADAALRRALLRGLRAHGFDVVGVWDGASSMRCLDPAPQAIILDIGLPDTDGRDVCQAMRSRGIQSPVIFLGGRHVLRDRLSCFAVGGDDYLARPFALAELIARLRAVLRRRTPAIEAPRGADDMWIDPVHHAVRWHDERVDLTPIEFNLLARLLARPEAVVRRAELRQVGWPNGDVVADNNLDQYMSRLRRKLDRLGAPHQVKAARGVGYRILPATDLPA